MCELEFRSVISADAARSKDPLEASSPCRVEQVVPVAIPASKMHIDTRALKSYHSRMSEGVLGEVKRAHYNKFQLKNYHCSLFALVLLVQSVSCYKAL